MPNDMTAEEIKKYLDLEAGLARVRNNKSLYKRMLGLFTKSQEFAAFEQALADNDLQRAADVAHAIKGMTGNLGLTRVFELSSKLMEQLRLGAADQAVIEDYRSALEITRACVDEAVTQLD